MNTVAAIRRLRALGPLPRRRKPKKRLVPRQPDAIRMSYMRKLNALLDRLWKVTRSELHLDVWDESKHPRHPAGDERGGRFAQRGLGGAVFRFTHSEESYLILGDNGTWGYGGCWLLASAVQEVFGGKLMALASDKGTEHVVVQIGDRYIDTDGASSEERLLRNWEEWEGVRFRLEPFDPEDARRRGILEMREKKKRLVAALRALKLDALDDVWWLLAQNLAEEMEQDFEEWAQDVADGVIAFQRQEWRRMLKEAIGQDLREVTDPMEFAAIKQGFITENVRLIKSIPARFFNDLAGHIAGDPKNLSEIIQRRYDVAKNIADRIANDQVGKLYGQLNRARQMGAGITEFIWVTMHDERVRETHRAKEGHVFNWLTASPIPGEEINCRCLAIPVFEEKP